MGSCKILHDTHLSWPVGWEPVRIISKSYNFLFGTTTTPTITFSNSHFFSGQNWHTSSPSIMLYLWLGARRPTAHSYNLLLVSKPHPLQRCVLFCTNYLSYEQANHILCDDVCFLVHTASPRSKPTTSFVTMCFFVSWLTLHSVTNIICTHYVSTCIFGIRI